MAIVFSEIPIHDEVFRAENLLSKAMRRVMRPSGAKIMIMGIGGAGRNAIRNMMNSGINPNIKLAVIDTQLHSDQELYS